LISRQKDYPARKSVAGRPDQGSQFQSIHQPSSRRASLNAVLVLMACRFRSPLVTADPTGVATMKRNNVP
jgi:hypothetical protein